MQRAIRVLALFILAGSLAHAQTYPVKPIRIVIPYQPGGGTDIVIRAVSGRLSERLGQPVVVDNRGGATGTIGSEAVAHAAPDGYTLVLGGTGTLAVAPTLYSNAGYDPRKDFAPVGLIATSALVVLVHPSVPATSLKELIALAKEKPGQLNFASAGVGSGMHLGTELFELMADVKLTHIPYKGTGPALTDLLGGHVALYFS